MAYIVKETTSTVDMVELEVRPPIQRQSCRIYVSCHAQELAFHEWQNQEWGSLRRSRSGNGEESMMAGMSQTMTLSRESNTATRKSGLEYCP
jgi:hypothetical protein